MPRDRVVWLRWDQSTLVLRLDEERSAQNRIQRDRRSAFGSMLYPDQPLARSEPSGIERVFEDARAAWRRGQRPEASGVQPAGPPAGPTLTVRIERGSGPVVVVGSTAPRSLNPYLAGEAEQDAARPVLEPLAAIDAEGALVPVLAYDVPTIENGGLSSDKRTVTWRLRPGVYWADGRELTAEDVIATYRFQALLRPELASSVHDVGAPDKDTVRITLATSGGDPYALFVGRRGLILQRHQLATLVDEMGCMAEATPCGAFIPIGTGPYQVVSFEPGVLVRYGINPNYRDKQRPFFRELQLGGGQAPSAALLAAHDNPHDSRLYDVASWTASN